MKKQVEDIDWDFFIGPFVSEKMKFENWFARTCVCQFLIKHVHALFPWNNFVFMEEGAPYKTSILYARFIFSRRIILLIVSRLRRQPCITRRRAKRQRERLRARCGCGEMKRSRKNCKAWKMNDEYAMWKWNGEKEDEGGLTETRWGVSQWKWGSSYDKQYMCYIYILGWARHAYNCGYKEAIIMLVIIRLRVFIQTFIFMDANKETKFKSKVGLFSSNYREHHILNILCIFAHENCRS